MLDNVGPLVGAGLRRTLGLGLGRGPSHYGYGEPRGCLSPPLLHTSVRFRAPPGARCWSVRGGFGGKTYYILLEWPFLPPLGLQLRLARVHLVLPGKRFQAVSDEFRRFRAVSGGFKRPCEAASAKRYALVVGAAGDDG